MAANGLGDPQDPWNRQYSMMRLGLISSCAIVAVVIVLAVSRSRGLPIAIGIAAGWIVLDSVFIYSVLRSVRKKTPPRRPQGSKVQTNSDRSRYRLRSPDPPADHL